nr:sensor domain-containing protein [Mycobacterium alsense]
MGNGWGMGRKNMRRFVAGAAVAGICIVGAGCHGQPDQAAKAPTTTRTTTAKVAPPVAADALKRFLLSPEQINSAMGAADMKVTNSRDEMSDDSATMTPRECLAIDGSAQAQVYAKSGFSALRDETLGLQEGDNLTHFAEQAVVLFPTAKQASAFFGASAQQWQACHDYTHVQSRTHWTVGAISNANGVLSTVTTLQDAPSSGWKACGRALTAKNNVVVDVNTCSGDPKNSAVDVANQIAAKVPA